MNSIDLLLERDLPSAQLAFLPLNGKPTHYGELLQLARNAQAQLKRFGVGPGSSVLLADSISAEFYASVMAILALGATVILVEPYLPLAEIESIVYAQKPEVMIASLLGRAWGVRVPAIRNIPSWISARALCRKSSAEKLGVESVRADTPGIITFTTGTTGRAKGVVRTHQGLNAQNQMIQSAGRFEQFKGPDLAVFANLVLANLGMGRGTIFVPPKWKLSDLHRIEQLPKEYQPETLSTGPAFFAHLLKLKSLPKLRSIHVGGAPTDCNLFEEGFRRFSETTRFVHVYGSSEAEPVTIAEARSAVAFSRERGYYQTLFLGKPVEPVQIHNEEAGLWVRGPHVCPYYIQNALENETTKRTDSEGHIWHFMGDRIEVDREGLWYQGRASGNPSDFALEQSVYSLLGSSHAFLFRDEKGALVLSGENLKHRETDLRKSFPSIERIQEKKIVWDRRHRARIDRGASR